MAALWKAGLPACLWNLPHDASTILLGGGPGHPPLHYHLISRLQTGPPSILAPASINPLITEEQGNLLSSEGSRCILLAPAVYLCVCVCAWACMGMLLHTNDPATSCHLLTVKSYCLYSDTHKFMMLSVGLFFICIQKYNHVIQGLSQ